MTNATSTQLQELYVAYFGRAADPTGLDYWTERGITTTQFASDMHAQAEFQDAYGSLSTESQVNQIYKNLFDREADVTGLTYWTQQINLGNLQLAEIATHLIWAAKNNSGSADDKTALTNRTDAAVAYTAEVKKTTSGILAYQAETTSPWKSGVNITEAISYLSGIDKDTTYTASGITTSVNTIKTNGVPTSSSAFNLTAATAGDDLVGTSGNDTFTGGSAARFQNADTITGGAGTDTLNTKITGNITATVDEIETIILDATGTASLDGANVGADTTAVTVKGGQTVTYKNAVQEVFTVAEASTGLTVTAKTGFTTATNDAITVNLGAAKFGTLTLGDVANSASGGYEFDTVNLVLSGDGSATLAEADAGSATGAGWNATTDTINITGTGDFELDIADAQIGGNTIAGSVVASKIDASGHTGSLTVDIGTADLIYSSAKNWTGVDKIKVATDDANSSVATQISDVASGTEVIITAVEATDNTVTIDPNGSATGESLTITLDVATAGSSAAFTTLTTDGFETLTINSTGTDSATTVVKNSITNVDGLSTDTTLLLTGDKKLTIGTAATHFVENTWTTITSTNTSGVDVSVQPGGALAFTGGTGADRILIDTLSDLTSADSFNGGAGTDTIAISQVISTDFSDAQIAAISNFEILEYALAQSSGGADTVDMTKLSGINELYVSAGITTSSTDILTVKGESGMTFRTNTVFADTDQGAALLIFDVKDAANAGTSDTVNFHSDIDLTIAGAANAGAFQIDNVENLNINISGVAGSTNDIQTILDIDGAQLSTLTITSDAGTTSGIANEADGLTLTTAETTLLSTFDATGFNGDLVVTGLAGSFIATGATIKGGSQIDTITGGTGADVITGGAGADILKGGNSNDNIDGGAGIDTITGEAGADTLTGGTGADIFVFGDAASTEAAMDVIKDFGALASDADYDTLDIVELTISKDESTGVDVKAATAITTDTSVTATVATGIITLGGTEKANVDTLAEWINVAEILLARNIANDTDTEGGTIAFEFSGDTYVVFGDDGDTNGGSAVDTYATEGVVKLEGVTGVTGIATAAAANTIVVA